MVAQLLFRDKYVYADGAIEEMVIWRLPQPDHERPHRLKYRLYYDYPGNYDYPGKPLVRYDNERGKGDHWHEGDHETRYTFVSVEQLIRDLKTDIERLRGEHDE